MTHPLRRLLLPLTPLYRLGLRLREAGVGASLEGRQHLRFPVISIGNLSTGGSGKTPFTIALARALLARGIAVDVLSRGYGRRIQAPARVNPAGNADEFGDEPLLIARRVDVPVYVAKQRYQAGLLGEQGFGAGKPLVHLLDDGFQHRQLAREVDIVLLDRADWTDRLLPAGNLREPLEAIGRATILALPASDPQLEEEIQAGGWKGPIWRLRRKMEIPIFEDPVYAFCGIARPEQFFAGLEQGGVRLAGQLAFADHYRYTAQDVERLLKNAHSRSAHALVTTEKDFARMGPMASRFPSSMPVHAIPLRIEIEQEDQAIDWLLDRLRLTSAHPPL